MTHPLHLSNRRLHARVQRSLHNETSSLPISQKLEILSIIDDYVFGHCTSLMRRGPLRFARKAANALSEAMNRYLDEGDYPDCAR